MRRSVLVAPVLLIVAAVPAHAADEPVTVPLGDGSVTVIAPEVKWSQPGMGCEDFPIEYRVAYPSGVATWWSIEGGVGSAAGTRGDVVSLRGTAPGTVRDAARLCPETVGYGSMRVEVRARLSSTPDVAVSVPFTLTRMRTKVRLTKVTGDAGSTTVWGKVRAYHPRTGWQPGDGSVRIQFKKPGRSWRNFGTTTASGGELKGRFEWTRFRALPKGTSYRATFLANAKQEPAVSAVLR